MMQIEKGQRIKLATVAILAFVLGAGFLLGAVWDRKHDVEAQTPFAPSADAQPRERGDRRTPLYARVSPALSDDQRAAADSILQRRREAARALIKESRIDSLYVAMKAAERAFKNVYDPRFQSLADSSRSAIKAVMTPEQAAQYDSLLALDRRRDGGSQGSR
jgi:hypothetical protein